jgi:tetratricopeptide (TPR) repeat protein
MEVNLGIILTGLALLTAAGTRADFDQANAAFAEKRYAQAANSYETIIRQHGYSAAVLFNLANADYCDGRVGRAILNYERAQLLAPDAADIGHNLSIACRRAGVAEPPAHWLDTYTLTGLGSLAAIMIAAGLLFRQVARRAGMAWIVVNTIVLLAIMFAMILRFPEHDYAIVVVNNAPAYSAPSALTQPIFVLSEGQSVSIRKSKGNFLLVDAGGGTRGWVTPATVERVMPM